MLSLVIPVYLNAESIPDLLTALEALNADLGGNLEVVFVVDGSPDQSFERLSRLLPSASFEAQLICLSRNFGSFSAIRVGLENGRGDLFAVMAADLQEPPELVVRFREVLLGGDCDIVVGTRESRNDPAMSRLLSGLFWFIYRRLVQPDMPKGGVDVFGCTRGFRDVLLRLNERNSTLVGLILWAGFRRAEVKYSRRSRRFGRSAWSFRRKLRYLLDSVFAFSDLPIRLLSCIGITGVGLSVTLAAIVLAARLSGRIPVPGYAATVLVVMFFGGLNSLGLGIVGEYLWRAFENTKERPLSLIAIKREFGK